MSFQAVQKKHSFWGSNSQQRKLAFSWRVLRLRRHRLQRLFSSFPEGWPGIGLIFLRLTVAVNAIIWAIEALAGPNSHAISAWVVESFAIAVGAAIFVGFLTPVASAAATVGYLMSGVSPFLIAEANHHISTLTAFNLDRKSVV